jgi:cytochrome oxidase Cu insertion factor (SCO1/SenC/PrrC family)
MKLNTLFAIALTSFAPLNAQADNDKPSYKIELPKNLGAVSFNGLTDHAGKQIDDAYTAEHFKGKKLAIYFGFPDCEWFCPPSAQAIKTASSDFKDVQFIFIASETGYTPKDMQGWLESFDGKSFKAIGITGEVDQLKQLHKAMRVHDERKIHLPLLILIDENGVVKGSAITIKPAPKKDDRPLPDPQSIIRGMEEKFKPQSVEVSNQNGMQPASP